VTPRKPYTPGDRYKWVALTNTTAGVLLATIDASIMIIAMPDIFRGIGLDPLIPGNNVYLLWMILGYLVTSSVLVVSVGRLGDLFGRVRMYNLGFVIYTAASFMLTIDWLTGRSGALWLLAFRIVQGIGGAFLVGNSGAILTDAFPPQQRGLALGINNIAGISGSFIGLVLGGLLAPINWRLVFLISVPCGIFGTIWAYLRLRDLSERSGEPVDWLGNVTFAAGLILVMTGITQGVQPYDGHAMGWSSPMVIGFLAGGARDPAKFQAGDMRIAMPRFQGEAFAANLALLERFEALAKDVGCTPAQLCLAWLIKKDPTLVSIPGTTRPKHMRENAGAAEIALSDEMAARVDELVNEKTVAGSRYPPALQASVDTERLPADTPA